MKYLFAEGKIKCTRVRRKDGEDWFEDRSQKKFDGIGNKIVESKNPGNYGSGFLNKFFGASIYIAANCTFC